MTSATNSQLVPPQQYQSYCSYISRSQPLSSAKWSPNLHCPYRNLVEIAFDNPSHNIVIIMSGCLNVETLSILNNYVPQKLACIISTYRRNWLLSARAYNTQQQENMFLTKSMRITGSMCLENMCLTKSMRLTGSMCLKNVPRVERPTTVAKKLSESIILDINISLLQPTSGIM